MSHDTHDQIPDVSGAWNSAFEHPVLPDDTTYEPPSAPQTTDEPEVTPEPEQPPTAAAQPPVEPMDYGTPPPHQAPTPPHAQRPAASATNGGGNGGNQSFDPLSFAGKYKWPLAIGAVILVIAVSVLSWLGWKNGIENEAFGRQRDVVTVYQGVQQELSNCLDTTLIGAQIADKERQSLKDLLIGTASARYVDASGKSVNTDQALNGGLAINFKSVNEAYPDVSNELYKQLMSNAVGCRNQFTGAMENLQAIAGRFDIWVHQGSIFEKPLRNKWPNDELVVTGLGGQKITGKAALTFLATPIITGDAAQAVQSHTIQNQQLFPTP